MKKIIVYTMMCVVTVWFVACATCRPVKKPANLKPLSKTEYNDVYTVYYNCKQNCAEDPNQYEGDMIMVCGYKSTNPSDNGICDDINGNTEPVLNLAAAPYNDSPNPGFLHNIDYGKKIYITGIIDNYCPEHAPHCMELSIVVFQLYVEE